MKLVLAAMASMFLAIGCSPGGGADSSRPVSADTVTGSWELRAAYRNGQQLPLAQVAPANKAGLIGGAGTTRLRITPKRLRMVRSDGPSAKADISVGYRIDGKTLVPEADSGQDFPKFEIVSFTDGSMTVRDLNERDAKTLLVFTRIDDGASPIANE